MQKRWKIPTIKAIKASIKENPSNLLNPVLEKIATPYSLDQEEAGITPEVEGDSVMQMDEQTSTT
jgi:hypothetical protein